MNSVPSAEVQDRRFPEEALKVYGMQRFAIVFEVPGRVAVGARVGGQADGRGVATRPFCYPPLGVNTYRGVAGLDRSLLVDGDADVVPMDLHEIEIPKGVGPSHQGGRP